MLYRICDVCERITPLDELIEVEVEDGEHALVCPSCLLRWADEDAPSSDF